MNKQEPPVQDYESVKNILVQHLLKVKEQVDDNSKGSESVAVSNLLASMAEKKYLQHHQRLRHFDSLIWGAGRILIPLSFAGFGALATLDDVETWHIVALGLASWMMMTSWVVIAENQRALWKKELAWVQAFEEVFLSIQDNTPGKVREADNMGQALAGSGAIRKIRFILMTVVTLGWAVLFFWHEIG